MSGNTLHLSVGIVIGTIFFGACSMNSQLQDVSADPHFWGAYKPGNELSVQTELLLMSSNPKEQVLFAPEQKTHLFSQIGDEYKIPAIKAYQEDPAKWPHISGIMPNGTHLKVTRLALFKTTTYAKLRVYAEVLNGKFKGHKVQIQEVSEFAPDMERLAPKPQLLKPK